MPNSRSYTDTGSFLLELYRKALSLREKELYEFFLDHAVNITKSKIGFFHFVGKDQKTIILTSWNRQALKNCSAEYDTHYPIEQAGNWADCIRLKQPVTYNDFKHSPNQKGLPDGHVAIKRLLTIPLMEEGKVYGIFGVGNKNSLYTKVDSVQLNLIGNELNKIMRQRLAEEQIRESREKYHSLFENMIDGFAYCKMVFDESDKPVDFIYLEVNDAFERLTGLKKESVLEKRVTEAIPGIKEANPELFTIYGKVAKTGIHDKFEVYFKPLSAWLSVSVYSPSKGYFAAVFENITERKSAEEILTKQAALIDLSPDGILVKNLDDVITFWNVGAERLYGWKKEEAIGQKASVLLKSRSTSISLKEIAKQLNKSAKWSGELIQFTKSGQQKFVNSCWLLMNHFGNEILETNIDITEQKCIQTKLEEKAAEVEEFANRMEELANERAIQLKDSERLAAIGATAGMVGHDIRNPLQAITSDIYLLKEELNSKPYGQEKNLVTESLDGIEKNVDYINKIVADLQDFARPLKPHVEEADMEFIINQMLEKAEVPSNVEVAVKVESAARKVTADSTFINRIMYNLVTNATQAMPNGGKLTIHVYKDKNSKEPKISVTDTGTGIPENVKCKLFTPMFTTKSKGQGFGLAVIKRMTEALGGAVTFESQEGKGTTFTVRLPSTQA